MALEIKARIICDGCGTATGDTTGCRFTDASTPAWTARDNAERAGWMTLNHGHYYPQRHFCATCQDKPLPKLPALKRRPKPDNSKCKLVGFARNCIHCGTRYEPITIGSKCPRCFPVT